MTTSLLFKTNLNCESCVAAVKPFLDDVPNISNWEVDTTTSDKILTVSGDGISLDSVTAAVAKAGFVATGSARTIKSQPDAIAAAEVPKGVTYYPLLLLSAILFGVVGIVELRFGAFDPTRAMQNFMGAFFLAFAFFKFLDLRGFADSYRMYDIVARRLPFYGFVYPFIELALGAHISQASGPLQSTWQHWW